ncbi:MAG: RidA family protein [Longimicrobiales bacterium]|nr:RidA family protein [Longimicrobiales bacterium]
MKVVHTPASPAPRGHYSQAIVHNGLVYVSGTLPKDPSDPDRRPGSVAEETKQAMRNLASILGAAGSGLDRLVQVTVYVTDMSMWPDVNRAYAEIMGEHRPARAVVPVKDLVDGYRMEVQAIAAVSE